MLALKKCGHEDLFISLMPGDPLTFYPEIHLSDLDGRSILLLTRIGFWMDFHADKTPNTNYLLQVDQDSFYELSINSTYPSFSSSYYISRGMVIDGKINIPLADPECHTDYFLACCAACSTVSIVSACSVIRSPNPLFFSHSYTFSFIMINTSLPIETSPHPAS